MKLDTLIIGAGPAGIFAGLELKKKKNNFLILEQGDNVNKRQCKAKKECKNCKVCDAISGVSGAGGFSDGKLCMSDVGISDNLIGSNYSNELEYVFSYMKPFINTYKQNKNTFKINCCNYTMESSDVIHLGSTNTRKMFSELRNSLADKVLTNTKVLNITSKGGHFVIDTENMQYICNNVILATGKNDEVLRPKVINKFKLKNSLNNIAFGIRLEVEKTGTHVVKMLSNNLKIKKEFQNGTVKTHCFCYGGEVIIYKYRDSMCLAGGHAEIDSLSDYTNVNILFKASNQEYNEQIRSSLNNLFSCYPNILVCEPLSNYFANCTYRKPTNAAVKEINFSNYINKTILNNLLDFIKLLDMSNLFDISKGVIYGPVAEWIAPKINCSEYFETSYPNLFFAGDTSGNTQGIMAAGVSGIRCARKILSI